MTSHLANCSNDVVDPLTHVIELAHSGGSGALAIGVGGMVGVLLFVGMLVVYFAVGRGDATAPTLPVSLAPPLAIPPYHPIVHPVVHTHVAIAPDPVGVFRTMPDPNAAVIETGPMSAVVISSKPGSDLADEDDFVTTVDADAFFDDGRTIIGLGTYSEELAEELALHATWLQEARRAELLATDSTPLITVLGEEELDLEDVAMTKKRPKIRQISPARPRYENHP